MDLKLPGYSEITVNEDAAYRKTYGFRRGVPVGNAAPKNAT
jgi:hypothetical protein